MVCTAELSNCIECKRCDNVPLPLLGKCAACPFLKECNEDMQTLCDMGLTNEELEDLELVYSSILIG